MIVMVPDEGDRPDDPFAQAWWMKLRDMRLQRDEARAEADGPAWVALTSKVEQLKGELDEAQDQILQLRALLREVEWGDPGLVLGDECIWCGHVRQMGHASDCRLNAAL